MSLLSQAFPPAPTYTEKSLPSLSSKTYIVTGGPSGIGFELAKILYSRSATVYLAARNPIKITEAIEAIDSAFPESTGRLEPFVVDLSDLTTVPIAAKAFKERNSKLDGLVLNAAVMVPPVGSRSKQGYELQMATNCLGGHLLLKCLEEVLINTAKTSAPGDVRVVWVSTILEFAKGVVWDEAKDEPKLSKNQMDNYVTSKVGDVFLAQDTADRLGKYGIIAMSVNPGLLKTELQRHHPAIVRTIMGIVFKTPKFGAYSELFPLLSPEVTLEKNGAFTIPWGRFGSLPPTIQADFKGKGQGGTGMAKIFVAWCEKQTLSYI